MANLHTKIERRRRSLKHEKAHLKHDIEEAKKRLVSASTVSVATLGGFLIGYFLIPHKIVRRVLKVITLATTAKQILEMIPHTAATTGRKIEVEHTRKVNIKKVH